MFEKTMILGLYTVSPMHAGSGAEISPIDQPIQREKHTNFPVVWGQSLKGVLRRAYKHCKVETYKHCKVEKEKCEIEVDVVFGPETTEKAHDFAGAISVGDAKILLFPVRSARGVFAYVTCPMVLKRFIEDIKHIKDVMPVEENASTFSFSPSTNQAIVDGGSSLLVSQKLVVLEEIVLEASTNSLDKLVSLINKISPVQIEKERVAIVHDDVFSLLVENATEVIARVKIGARGTVEKGHLWYEEYLPSNTLLYSLILVGKPRKENSELKNAEDIANALKNAVKKVSFIQIGGNETVGKGFTKIKLFDGEKDEKSGSGKG